MTLDLWRIVEPAPFPSTPVTNPHEAPPAPAGGARIRIPPRRRRPSAMPPDRELRRRLLREGAKSEMVAAIDAILEGTETPTRPLELTERTWLTRLVVRPCRAHRGLEDQICPGPLEISSARRPRADETAEEISIRAIALAAAAASSCRGSVRGEEVIECDHRCPGPPACPGSMGRLVACSHAQIYEERNCGTWYAIPLSCHVPGCPDCEPQRQAKHALHYEAVVGREDPRDVVLMVLTAQNPRAGELAPALRSHARHLAKMRRSPVWTGRGACVARTADGGPFHPCAHPAHRWKCQLEERCARDLASRDRARRRRARRRCRLLARRRRPCDHPSCRPNCASYRHRGVAGGVWATECPPSLATPGTWNLHTNAIVSLRSDDGRRGLRWLAPWAELSWYWRRATCPTHKRCPGSPVCAGGAWDLHVEGYEPRSGIREYLKYVTKSAEILEHAGAAGLVEFLLARRRVKFLSAFGSFFGVRFISDRAEERAAEADTVPMWISDFSSRPMPKICPACSSLAAWDGQGVLCAKTELRLIGGFLAWRRSTAPP
jgi:hypothetical protein